MYLDRDFFTAALEGVHIRGEIPQDPHFCIDSRKLQSGEIFIALKGHTTDGHNFVKHALEAGASGVIVEKSQESCLSSISSSILQNKCIIIVPNTYKALLTLASEWRKKFSCPIFAITGSVGKTGTKEVLMHILKTAGRRYIATPGTQNTVLGVALTLLDMRPHHEGAIFEVGISKRGEMARIAELLKPTHALITTIGHSHMEGLGSLQDIALEKRDIFKYFKEDSIGILCGDQPLLSTLSYAHPIIKFGSKTINQIQARKVHVKESSLEFVLKLYQKKYKVTLPSYHIGYLYNVLGAVSAAHLLGIPHETIINAIHMPVRIPGRFELCTLKDNKGILINDCYNASPESMKAALIAFEKIACKGIKMAILGDMLELGMTWRLWHRQLGRLLLKVPSLKHVIFVGEHVKLALNTVPVGISVEHALTWRDALEKLHSKLNKDSVILVKASRGIGLDNLVNAVR